MFSFSNYKFRQIIDVVGGKFFCVCLLASLQTLAIMALLVHDGKNTADLDSLIVVTSVFILSQIPVPVKVRNKTDDK